MLPRSLGEVATFVNELKTSSLVAPGSQSSRFEPFYIGVPLTFYRYIRFLNCHYLYLYFYHTYLQIACQLIVLF